MQLISHAPRHVALSQPFFYTTHPTRLLLHIPTSDHSFMADIRDRQHLPHQLQFHSQYHPGYDGGMKSHQSDNGPTAGQILAVVTLLPVGGSLLGLAGMILAGTVIGLAVATPLFVIFSPVLVPAAIVIAGAVTGILTSGAFGLTGLASLSWVLNCFRQSTGQEPVDYAKWRLKDTARYAGEVVGEKAKQTGEAIKYKAQEGGGGTGTGTGGGGGGGAAAGSRT